MIPQPYNVMVMPEESVLQGNNAVIKCHIPSFVSDFVSVTAWLADDGTAYFSDSSFGK